MEFIGKAAFCLCTRLQTIFIPPSCTEIGDYAFWASDKFIIFTVPFNTQLGEGVVGGTALSKKRFANSIYRKSDVESCIKTLNDGQDFALHLRIRPLGLSV